MKNSGLGGALALPLALCASPALADHPVSTAVESTAGSLDVAGPDTLEKGAFALGLDAVLVAPQERSDEELERLAEQDIHAHTVDYLLRSRLALVYGVTDRLTLSASLPLVHREGLREGEHEEIGGMEVHEVVQLGDVTGIGDLTVLAKYRLGTDAGMGAAFFAGLKLPKGETHAESPEGERLETEHQPGTGSWDPLLGAALGWAWESSRIDTSLFYQFATTGSQDTRLGDRLRAGVALAHRLGNADHHGVGAENEGPHGHAAWDIFASASYEWEGRETVAGEREEGSGGEVLWLSSGARYTTAGGLALAASLGAPLWQDVGANHPDNRLRFTLSATTGF
ncbi:transporter [Erythrobacter sp. SD-21]|uniref:transporter n=1 Tax=Erythrobacter sp. SD-21 TaxID=161528 RepID=UPI000153EE81|nr:transporter [Erythrobacter sp. SD-21]EDL48907.1 hypothetical protein ED21_24291 [Erythrobacter sp. SD-21]